MPGGRRVEPCNDLHVIEAESLSLFLELAPARTAFLPSCQSNLAPVSQHDANVHWVRLIR